MEINTLVHPPTLYFFTSYYLLENIFHIHHISWVVPYFPLLLSFTSNGFEFTTGASVVMLPFISPLLVVIFSPQKFHLKWVNGLHILSLSLSQSVCVCVCVSLMASACYFYT